MLPLAMSIPTPRTRYSSPLYRSNGEPRSAILCRESGPYLAIAVSSVIWALQRAFRKDLVMQPGAQQRRGERFLIFPRLTNVHRHALRISLFVLLINGSLCSDSAL